ncbi:MAG: FAD-dependent oxidoreductase [Saprospiraceae bacterium]|nr:FAD-dependent oxidoreductase [Saprospiraceae bacterium]
MKVVIIGNGIAGTTAARYIRKKSQHKILMISSECEFPYSRTALMYIYMGHMKWEHTKLYDDQFWIKNRINRLKDHVIQINIRNKKIALQSGNIIDYDRLIIASGSQSNNYICKGNSLIGVQALYHLQDLHSLEEKTNNGINRAVIVGGGLIGIELAEMLSSRNIPVTMLVREKSFWNNILPEEESQLINNHIRTHGIDLRLDEELEEILGETTVQSINTKSGTNIICNFVGLTIGVSPNISFVKDSELKLNKGILVDSHLQTNIEDIFAIGDCAELLSPDSGRKSIEAVWYTGKIMGKTVASTICGLPTEYHPGIWYNSAKFFDIEYQVYGYVPVKDPNTDSIYWEHKNGLHSIRLVYDKSSSIILGFNLLGIRYRHEVCEKWIKEKYPIQNVIENLSLANFDPEFYPEFESEIVNLFNQKCNKTIRFSSSRSLDLVNQFLNT